MAAPCEHGNETGLHEKYETSCLAERLSASDRGLCILLFLIGPVGIIAAIILEAEIELHENVLQTNN
jgi:hypothetical protein